mgnify:CR=1 FL=1|tara:strand:- start:18 stop:221 length:204 start_codon:yes stop_codon:yes gene_type:complete
MAEFQFLIDGKLVTYDRYEDIPETFDHVIKFIPDIPPEPHTEDEHAEMALWNIRLQQLMEKERARSN